MKLLKDDLRNSFEIRLMGRGPVWKKYSGYRTHVSTGLWMGEEKFAVFGRSYTDELKKFFSLLVTFHAFAPFRSMGGSVGRRYRVLCKHIRNRAVGFFVRSCRRRFRINDSCSLVDR